MHFCQDLNWKQLIKEYKENEKIIDLHTHTNYSDGELSIDELIKLAIKKKIGVLGITDHDTLEGVKRIDRTNSMIVDSGIKIINGIELTAKVPTGKNHNIKIKIYHYWIILQNKIIDISNL